MNTLVRGRYGQQNLNIFFRSDVILYVEGGDQGSGYEGLDKFFWRKVVEEFSNKNVQIIPRGCKQDLIIIAKELIDYEVDNVVVALDRDLDDISGCCIDDHRIIYTYGYSRENDQLDLFDWSSYICEICAASSGTEDKEDAVNQEVERALVAFRRPVLIDQCIARSGIAGGAYSKKAYLKYFDNSSSFVILNKSILYNDAIQALKLHRSFINFDDVDFDFRRRLHGHSYLEIYFRAAQWLYKIILKISIPKRVFDFEVIRSMDFGRNSVLKDHYAASFARAGI